jgi:hypothetical protein
VLGEPEPHVLGYLELLWLGGHDRGDAYLGDAVDVELAAKYPHQPGKLCKALLECRFIDEIEPGKFQIHDLDENAPEYVRTRMRVRRHRAKKATETEPNASESDDVLRYCNVTETLPSVTVTHSNTTQHNTNTEKTSNEVSSVCSEPQAAREPAASKPIEEKTILTFPTSGKGAKEWHLIESKLAEFREAFPALDVYAECRKALCWVNANPGNKKTASGMARFLFGWLSRSQNKGHAKNAEASHVETREEKIARQRRESEARKLIHKREPREGQS